MTKYGEGGSSWDIPIGLLIEAMEKKLNENDHKSGWDDMQFDECLDRALEELDELNKWIARKPNSLHSQEELQAIISEAADVANFMMFIVHNARTWLEGEDG